MSDDQADIVHAGYAALAELRYMHDVAVESLVNEVRERTGERLLVRQPGVLDASYGDLARMAVQVEHYAEAWRLVRGWLLPNDHRSLGAILKVMPAQVAQEVTDHLRKAGVLAEEGPRPSP